MKFLDDLKRLNTDAENFTEDFLHKLGEMPFNWLAVLFTVVVLLAV